MPEPISGSRITRYFVEELRAGGFWTWLIGELDDADVDTIYQCHLSDPVNAPVVALASALYTAKTEGDQP